MKWNRKLRKVVAALMACALLAGSSGLTTLAEDVNSPDDVSGAAQTAPAGETQTEPSEDIEDIIEEEVKFSFSTGVYILDEEGNRIAVPDILIRLYDADTYEEEADNPVVAEGETAEDGSLLFEGIAEGNYRVEFVDQSETFDPKMYAAAELPEGTEYTVTLASDEKAAEEAAGEAVKERTYFAWMGTLSLSETTEASIELKEKESPTEENASSEEDADVSEGGAESSQDETEASDDPKTELTNPEETAGGEGSPSDSQEGEELSGSNTEPPVELSFATGSIAALASLDETIAGAALERARYAANSGKLRAAAGNGWTFDAYYVNEDDKYYVEKDSSFNLKYQMEFHTNQPLPAGSVEIRIPAVLLTYRNSTAGLTPQDIAVPNASPEAPVSSKATPFNYYLDVNTQELVFFNYTEIPSGSNAAWQVLYKDLDAMKIVDGTTWSLTPKVKVTTSSDEGTEEPVAEERETEPLTGLVDTYARLTSVSKTPYSDSGKSYTPGLYTESQVESYIRGDLPYQYSGKNFYKYKYVVWEVRVKGNGTQPFNLYVNDTSKTEGGVSGSVVGYRNAYSSGYQSPVTEQLNIGNTYAKAISNGKETSWGSRFFVVTAYPVDQIEEGTVLENTVNVRLEPYDQKDESEEKSDDASYSYADYHWLYEDGVIWIDKWSGANRGTKTQTYNGWLEIYQKMSEKKEDYGRSSLPLEGISEGMS